MLDRAPILAKQVLGELERRIFDGSIAPGQKVNESHLAMELQVSRGPIREACRLLESERLLETFPQRGSFVRCISEKEAADLFDVRNELSGIIARKVAEADAAALSKELDHWAGEMDLCIRRGDTSGFFPANIAYHEALLRATGNARLCEIFLSIFKELRLFRIRSLLIDRQHPERVNAYNRASNAGHHRIIRAIDSGDAARIKDALEDQVAASRQRSFAAFERAQAFEKQAI